jgi:hypothetical protein
MSQGGYGVKKTLVLVFIIGIIGALLANASGNALTLMTPPQKITLETLRSFKSGTTKVQISNIFGEPVKSTIGETTISWEINQASKITRVKAYFLTGELNKIQLLSLEPFWGYTLYYSKEGVSNET